MLKLIFCCYQLLKLGYVSVKRNIKREKGEWKGASRPGAVSRQAFNSALRETLLQATCPTLIHSFVIKL